MSETRTSALERALAKHQLADILPGGVVCICGAELAALNAPLDDGAVKGEPLALAVHQLQQMFRCGRCAWCLGDRTPRARGYELTCPHGFGCCQNCAQCKPALAGEVERLRATIEDHRQLLLRLCAVLSNTAERSSTNAIVARELISAALSGLLPKETR
jgi:hypothetical protein